MNYTRSVAGCFQVCISPGCNPPLCHSKVSQNKGIVWSAYLMHLTINALKSHLCSTSLAIPMNGKCPVHEHIRGHKKIYIFPKFQSTSGACTLTYMLKKSEGKL